MVLGAHLQFLPHPALISNTHDTFLPTLKREVRTSLLGLIKNNCFFIEWAQTVDQVAAHIDSAGEQPAARGAVASDSLICRKFRQECYHCDGNKLFVARYESSRQVDTAREGSGGHIGDASSTSG
jgi:hypothetical protein